MPGRGSYGPAGKWIHDRANHILGKNPDMPKGMAYAVATQQAHKVGKSPKRFRTKEGVRTARRKHFMPTKMYKKTASEEKTKVAFVRLKKIQKLAETKRMPTTRGSAFISTKRPPKRKKVRLSPGMEAKARSKLEQRVLGGAPYKVQPRGTPGFAARVGERVIGGLSDAASQRIANIGTDKPMPTAPKKVVAPAKKSSKLLKSKALRKALQVSGLLGAGLGTGALAHQAAHSVGLMDTGPADTLADIVVPSKKYSYDREATRQLVEGNMYIPRHYLEKAAASMAGAVDDNESDMHDGEPGMFGPEASVIPQQTLETVVPIMDHVDKADKEADSFIQRMFDHYKSTKEESVGRYTKGETEIPLAKQAGRLFV